MMIIAVSQRVDHIAAYSEVRDSLDNRLVNWLLDIGSLPVPVPNKLGDSVQDWLDHVRPCAIVLSGGNDINSNPDRDKTENALLNHAKCNRLPLLGICRGMQMMVHWFGGRLVQIGTAHVRERHALDLVIAGDGELPREVNSYHAWGLNECPEHFSVLATAPDGTIEAIQHKTLPWEGWMWHPERDYPPTDIELARARKLFKRAK